MELTPQQLRILENLHKRSFEIVAFPMYANHIGVRKGNCAALLASATAAGSAFSIFSGPFYLINGNLTVKIRDNGRNWFVWKKERLEVTPERQAELEAFAKALRKLLQPQ